MNFHHVLQIFCLSKLTVESSKACYILRKILSAASDDAFNLASMNIKCGG